MSGLKLIASAATASVDTDALGEVYIPASIPLEEVREILETAAFRSVEACGEPGIQQAFHLPAEQQAILDAHDFLRRRRAELGVESPLPPITHLLSELSSATGFAGNAEVEDRICRRFPAADADEHPLLTRILWIHEIAHASGVLHVDSIDQGTLQIKFGRLGCRLLDPDKKAWNFSAFEELAASSFERDFAKEQGVSETARVSLCSVGRTALFRLPPGLEDGGMSRKILALRALPEYAELTLAGATPHSDVLGSRTIGVGRKVIEQGTLSIHSVYGELLYACDAIAEHLYPTPSAADAVRAFRADIQRIQGGAPHSLVTNRIEALLGTRGVAFFASLGSQDYTQLFNNSLQMQLLDCLRSSLELPPACRRAAQDLIFDLNDAVVEWQRQRNAEPEPRKAVVSEAVEESIRHLQKLDLRAALDALTKSQITHDELSQAQADSLCLELARQKYRLPESSTQHFIFRRLLSHEQLTRFASEAHFAQARITSLIELGDFSEAAELTRSCGFCPLVDRAFNRMLLQACLTHLEAGSDRNFFELAEFCKEFHIELHEEISPAFGAELTEDLLNREYRGIRPAAADIAHVIGVLGLVPQMAHLAQHGYSPSEVAPLLATNHPETFARWSRSRNLDLTQENFRQGTASGIEDLSQAVAWHLSRPFLPSRTAPYLPVPSKVVEFLDDRLRLQLSLLGTGKPFDAEVRLTLSAAAQNYASAGLLKLSALIEKLLPEQEVY